MDPVKIHAHPENKQNQHVRQNLNKGTATKGRMYKVLLIKQNVNQRPMIDLNLNNNTEMQE